ncbi:MAG: nucleotide exchange factor GrpE [Ignavibacterium sp.]|nr:nucleotide exchange factor GrpE [Ignavibacterium sp.]
MPKKNVNDENLEELNETNQTESELKEEINNEQPASEKLSDEEKIRTLEAEVANYKDLMLRKAAEFENYKRRTENEQVNLLKYAC